MKLFEYFKNIDYKKIIKSCIVFLSFYFYYLLARIPIIMFNIKADKVNDVYRVNALLNVFVGLCFFIFLIIIYWKDIVKEFVIYKDNLGKNFDTGLCCWAVGMFLMIIFNAILVFVFKSSGADNENSVKLLVAAYPLVMAFDVCILAPFNEEFVFRKTLYDVCKNKRLFVVLSFLLFGLAHVYGTAETLTDWLYIIPYGVMGGAFAVAYSKSDSIFTSMTFHIIHNILSFIITVIAL